MSSTGTSLNFSKLKITYLLLSLALLVSMGSYGWHLYALFREARLNMPQPQVEKLVKDLRIYQSRTKRFPNTFKDINDLIWHTRPAPNYGANGRQAHTKNYYYFYTRVNDDNCAFWAIPLGPKRQYASAFFLVISNDWIRIWQGKALDEAVITKLPAIPSPDELAVLQLQELRGRMH